MKNGGIVCSNVKKGSKHFSAISNNNDALIEAQIALRANRFYIHWNNIKKEKQ